MHRLRIARLIGRGVDENAEAESPPAVVEHVAAERAAAIEDAGTSAWDRAQMTAAMGGAPGAEEAVDSSDEERHAWQKEEMEAQLAELAAAKEEEEAQAAEANYSKEEQEAKEKG